MPIRISGWTVRLFLHIVHWVCDISDWTIQPSRYQAPPTRALILQRSDMNPPSDRDAVLARYTEGPIVLERAIADLQDADLDALPSQGGWTIRQIVHHIVDGDDIWKTCIKMAIGSEHAEFALSWYWALPQDTWANRWRYTERSLEVSMALLRANRDHILQILEHIPDGLFPIAQPRFAAQVGRPLYWLRT